MAARQVVVHGVVQGVFFRASCGEVARDAGVAGWVQNRPDGTVEAWFEGPDDALASLVAWCHEGPARAHVTRVEARAVEPRGLRTFEVR